MKNFYKVLEISETATQEEVKKAYRKLLRKFSPEKNPEEYKTIREAYDTLKDENSKRTYDVFFKYGDKINELEKNGKGYFYHYKYDKAIECFKEILKIDEYSILAREFIGESYLLKRKYKKASMEYIILSNKYPENISYLCNLGHCYEEMGRLEKAEKLYLKAYFLDKENKENMNYLINLYWKQKRYLEVEKILKEDILKDEDFSFKNYYSFSKLLETYVHMNDIYKILEIAKDLKKIIPNDSQIRGSIYKQLIDQANNFWRIDRYELVEIFLKLGKLINTSENKKLDKAIEVCELYNLNNSLLNDEKIESFLKNPLIYKPEEAEKEKKESFKNIDKYLKIYTEEYGSNIKSSLERIKKYYGKLYSKVKKEYSKIERLNNIQIKIIEEKKKILSHKGISPEFKKVIEALLNKDSFSFKECLNLLKKESQIEIKNNLMLIKKISPNICKENLKQIDMLENL